MDVQQSSPAQHGANDCADGFFPAAAGVAGIAQRVRKATSGASKYFVYDEADHLIGEYDSAGNLIAETIWFDDIPVAVLKPNTSIARILMLLPALRGQRY